MYSFKVNRIHSNIKEKIYDMAEYLRTTIFDVRSALDISPILLVGLLIS